MKVEYSDLEFNDWNMGEEDIVPALKSVFRTLIKSMFDPENDGAHMRIDCAGEVTFSVGDEIFVTENLLTLVKDCLSFGADLAPTGDVNENLKIFRGILQLLLSECDKTIKDVQGE